MKSKFEQIIKDNKISATALGIYLVLIVEYPDCISKDLVEDRFADASIKISRNAINKAFKELLDNQYLSLVLKKSIDENNKPIFNGTEYIINY